MTQVLAAGAFTRPTVETDPRWARVLARDREADGVFWYSVATTGVYCRPSCASRTARPANVALHASLAEARATGFRPCKRCNPEGPSRPEHLAGVVAAACRRIAASETAPTLTDLAAAAGLSPGFFHRQFKAATGVTPKAYAAERRAGRVRAELAGAGTVTDAIYGAGFGSSGRFYAASAGLLGMTPTRVRAGGAAEILRFAVGQCSLGAILVACSERGVAAITLGDDPDALARDLQDRFPKATLVGGDVGFEAVVAQVVGLADAPGTALSLPLDVRGTAFQRRVWEALRAIPLGRTATYADIARAIGSPQSVRAVAGACAANPLALAVPCHRVIRLDGSLSGYRWGVERKRVLLDREAGRTGA